MPRLREVTTPAEEESMPGDVVHLLLANYNNGTIMIKVDNWNLLKIGGKTWQQVTV